jgi:hypothetical protein
VPLELRVRVNLNSEQHIHALLVHKRRSNLQQDRGSVLRHDKAPQTVCEQRYHMQQLVQGHENWR